MGSAGALGVTFCPLGTAGTCGVAGFSVVGDPFLTTVYSPSTLTSAVSPLA